jgi:predicted nucleic acid-binding protein
MDTLLIYLDNCCFNRPYDTQNQEKVRLGTEAKLYVQALIRQGELRLVWSFILDFENQANPFIDRRESISEWKALASCHVPAIAEIAAAATGIASETTLRPKDALHVASAIHAGAAFLLTTDRKLLNTVCRGIRIMNPVDFVFFLSERSLR